MFRPCFISFDCLSSFPFSNNIYFKLTFLCLILPILKACHAENRPLSLHPTYPPSRSVVCSNIWKWIDRSSNIAAPDNCGQNATPTAVRRQKLDSLYIFPSLSRSDIFYICGLEMWHNGMLPTLPLPTSHCHTPFPQYAHCNMISMHFLCLHWWTA